MNDDNDNDSDPASSSSSSSSLSVDTITTRACLLAQELVSPSSSLSTRLRCVHALNGCYMAVIMIMNNNNKNNNNDKKHKRKEYITIQQLTHAILMSNNNNNNNNDDDNNNTKSNEKVSKDMSDIRSNKKSSQIMKGNTDTKNKNDNKSNNNKRLKNRTHDNDSTTSASASERFAITLLTRLLTLASTGEAYICSVVSVMIMILTHDTVRQLVINDNNNNDNITNKNHDSDNANAKSVVKVPLVSTLSSLLNSSVEYESRARILACLRGVFSGSGLGSSLSGGGGGGGGSEMRAVVRGCVKSMRQAIMNTSTTNDNNNDKEIDSGSGSGNENASHHYDALVLEDGFTILQSCLYSSHGVASLKAVVRDTQLNAIHVMNTALKLLSTTQQSHTTTTNDNNDNNDTTRRLTETQLQSISVFIKTIQQMS